MEAGALQRDQFVHTAKSQSKWYHLHTEPNKDSSDSVKSWHTGSSRLNSTYLRIARQAALPQTHLCPVQYHKRTSGSGKGRQESPL